MLATANMPACGRKTWNSLGARPSTQWPAVRNVEQPIRVPEHQLLAESGPAPRSNAPTVG